MNSKVDAFVSNTKKFQPEIKQLPILLLNCGLTKEFKWRNPFYSFGGNNVILIAGFKEFCALSFSKKLCYETAICFQVNRKKTVR